MNIVRAKGYNIRFVAIPQGNEDDAVGRHARMAGQ